MNQMVKDCQCCNEAPATCHEHGWISDMSGLTGGLTLIEGRSTYHAFKGWLCGDCSHDYMRADEYRPRTWLVEIPFTKEIAA